MNEDFAQARAPGDAAADADQGDVLSPGVAETGTGEGRTEIDDSVDSTPGAALGHGPSGVLAGMGAMMGLGAAAGAVVGASGAMTGSVGPAAGAAIGALAGAGADATKADVDATEHRVDEDTAVSSPEGSTDNMLPSIQHIANAPLHDEGQDTTDAAAPIV